jgi:hypothetical protein
MLSHCTLLTAKRTPRVYRATIAAGEPWLTELKAGQTLRISIWKAIRRSTRCSTASPIRRNATTCSARCVGRTAST